MYKSEKATVIFRIEGETESMEIGCLGTASISSSMDIDSRSCIGVSYPQKTAMSMDWTVNFDGIVDISEGSVQERLFEAYKAGKRIEVTIIYNQDPLDGYEGTVLISDWNVSLSAPGVAELSFTGSGTSELFIIHEYVPGVSITILADDSVMFDGYDFNSQPGAYEVFPDDATVTWSSENITTSAVTVDGGVVAYNGATSGQQFRVIATATATVDGEQKQAIARKVFTIG